jgi:hypothetical protein
LREPLGPGTIRPVRRLVIVLGLTVGMASCGSASPSSAPYAKSVAAAPEARPNATAVLVSDGAALRGARNLLRGLRNPDAYLAGGSLYVTQDSKPMPRVEITSEVMRIDPVSGRVLATRSLGSEFGQALLAGGDLWVIADPFTGSRHSSYWLFRLDPHSLVVRSRTILPATSNDQSIGSLAVADNRLWVGAGTLDRVSLASGRVERILKLRYPGPVQVAADPAGRLLLASLGSVHPTYIARLNPRTGAVQAHTTALWSSLQPSIAGIVAGGAWIDNGSGMTTTSFRIDLQTLRPTLTDVPAIPGSRIFATPIDGILWVTKPDAGNTVTYCADPVTGQLRARLPLLRGSSLLTVKSASIYYSDASPTGLDVLKRAPIDPRCTSSKRGGA